MSIQTALDRSPSVPVVIAGCFLLSFLSSFGQTFFISLFGPDVRAVLGLSDGGFGIVYSVATLLSAATMVWAGGLIDAMSARRFVVLSLTGLALVAAGFALMHHVVLLFAVLFGLRLTGQGMLSHAGITVAARASGSRQGRGLAFASAGHPAGEAVFPLLTVAAIAWIGWRETWGVVALACLAAMALVPLMLPRGAPSPASDAAPGQGEGRSGIRRQVLGETRFWWAFLGFLASPFVGTGLIFHQASIAEAKGWSLELIAGSFTFYAVGSVVAAFTMGWLIDRLGIRRLFGWHLLPMAVGTLVLALTDHPLAAPVYMVTLGLSAGSSGIAATGLLAAFYGLGNLGTVRALAVSIMIFSTALSPGLFGVMADLGTGWGAVALISTVLTLAAIVTARRAVAAREDRSAV